MNLGRKKILLNELLVEGAWVDEPKKVKEETKKNFDERIREVDEERSVLDGVKFKEISV